MENKKDRDKEKAKKQLKIKQNRAEVIRLKINLRSLRGASSTQIPLRNGEIFL